MGEKAGWSSSDVSLFQNSSANKKRFVGDPLCGLCHNYARTDFIIFAIQTGLKKGLMTTTRNNRTYDQQFSEIFLLREERVVVSRFLLDQTARPDSSISKIDVYVHVHACILYIPSYLPRVNMLCHALRGGLKLKHLITLLELSHTYHLEKKLRELCIHLPDWVLSVTSYL